jgi:hypothetical protein
MLASAAAADTVKEQLPQHKRGKYTSWFDSPYINDIIVAYARSGGSARRTVQSLKSRAADSRFERLSHSTVATWFDDKGKLKQQYQQQLQAGQAAVRYGGASPALAAAAGADDAICDILLKLRQAGTPLNSHIIRWVMLAVLQEKHPAVLETLTLSQTYISSWVRGNPRLHFRWRARTTAASKVLLDWHLPAATAASIAARVDITHSVNHWSTQETMQRWITHVLLPHSERMIKLHELDSNAHILLLLDAWAVHKSAEFRGWLKKEHPRIHLIYVPANCTSKLQLCDVALQRPFKSVITASFNEWAAQTIAAQIHCGEISDISAHLRMAALKPLVLQWCVESWKGLRERKELILDGWEQSCLTLFDITSEKRRREAVELIALNQLCMDELPEGTELDGDADSDSGLEDDELDTSKPRQFGKQSERVRKQTKLFGYMIDPTRVEIDTEPAAAAATPSHD